MSEDPDLVFRICDLTLDEKSVVRRNADVEHERAVAIFDLLEDNFFKPLDDEGGPYELTLSVAEDRLNFKLVRASGEALDPIQISLRPFRKVIKDYFTVCESYFEAIRSASPSRIEAIDMGRRGLHNEGSEILRERLAELVEVDHETARRLFTLLCVLHVRG